MRVYVLVAWLEHVLDNFCIGALLAELFVETDNDRRNSLKRLCASREVLQHQRDSGGWEMEHLEAFRDHGLTWPADFAEGSATLKVLNEKGTCFDVGRLTTRQAELLFFYHSVFHYLETCVEFVDVNPSLGRAFNTDVDKNPWRTTVPTLTGTAIICVRYKRGGVISVRALDGLEVFQIMGFDASFLHEPVAANSSLLINMAGNAFSAFAVTPMLMVALSGVGLIGALEEPPPKAPRTEVTPDVINVITDSDVDSDED